MKTVTLNTFPRFHLTGRYPDIYILFLRVLYGSRINMTTTASLAPGRRTGSLHAHVKRDRPVHITRTHQ